MRTKMTPNRNIDGTRMIVWTCLVFVVGGMLLVWQLIGRGPDLATISWGQRRVLAAVLAAVLVGLFVVMLRHQRRLVMRVQLDAGGRHLLLTTATIWGQNQRTIACADVVRAEVHGGDARGEDALSDPWLRIEVRDQGSWVLPLAGEVQERERLLQALQLRRFRDETTGREEWIS